MTTFMVGKKIVLTEKLLKASLLLFVQLWYNGRNYKGRKRVPRITSSFMHYALCMYTHSQHPSWPQLCRLVLLGTQAIRSGSHHLKKTNYIAKKNIWQGQFLNRSGTCESSFSIIPLSMLLSPIHRQRPRPNIFTMYFEVALKQNICSIMLSHISNS